MARFDSEKRKVLEDYTRAKENDLIDHRIIPILDLLNSHKDYYSTSSCSGRVLLLELATPGAKDESQIIIRWHDTFSSKQLEDGLAKWKKYRYLYLLAQAAIFHIIARNLRAAAKLRNLGDSSGFKYSSLRSIKTVKDKPAKSFNADNDQVNQDFDSQNSRITVELLATERLNTPLGFNGKILVGAEYLELLVDLANQALRKSHEKVQKLETILRKYLINK